MHVLVVEDDARLRRLLGRLLSVDRHVVEEAPDARTALELARMADGLDAIILDIGLPDRSGLEVARELRGRGSSVPILMLTARDAIDDRVRGLDSGADDYLVKPFAYEELSARLRALGRRGRNGARRTARLINGPITLDDAMREVTVEGRPISLSPRGAGANARPAARRGLAVRGGGDAEHSRCLRAPAAREARARRERPDPDRAGRWVPTPRA